MRLGKLIIVAILSMVTLGSCQDNDRRNVEENERVEMDRIEAEREAEMRADQQRLDRESNSITARIEDNRELSTFSQGMTDARVSKNFRQDEGPYTVFAPSDEAYNNLSPEERNQVMDTQNTDRSSATMSYLIVEGRMTKDQLRQQIEGANGNYTLNTMQGEEITASMDGDDIVLKDASGNTARITDTDTEASNGIIHVIDDVLRPQDPSTNEAADRYMQNNQNNTNLNNDGSRSGNTNPREGTTGNRNSDPNNVNTTGTNNNNDQNYNNR